jgi:hypothetical protein
MLDKDDARPEAVLLFPVGYSTYLAQSKVEIEFLLAIFTKIIAEGQTPACHKKIYLWVDLLHIIFEIQQMDHLQL